MNKKLPFLFIILNLLLLSLKAQVPVYVNLNATGQNNGTSWTDAYTDLQTAIDSAAAGSEIWVAKGVYMPSKKLYNGKTEYDKSFLIDKSLKLYGGFAGTETDTAQRSPNDTTILSAQLNAAVRAFHVMAIIATRSDSVTINRFTVRDGYAQHMDTYSEFVRIPDSLGIRSGYEIIVNSTAGGIYVFAQNRSRVSISGNNFTNNQTPNRTAYGGGMLILAIDSAGIIAEANVFYRNYSENGGGIHMGTEDSLAWITVTNNIFRENGGSSGGGINVPIGYNINIADNLFIKNSASDGGGICLRLMWKDSGITITGNNFIENEAAIGGGMSCYPNEAKQLRINNNAFFRNKALIEGGGLHIFAGWDQYSSNLLVFNNTISENNCEGGFGGGIYIYSPDYSNSNLVFSTNIITKNKASYGGGVAIRSLYTNTGTETVLTKNQITYNTASFGAGVYCQSGDISENFIAYNSADSCGGGCYVSTDESKRAVLKNNLITGNKADSVGGIYAVSYYKGNSQLVNNSIVANTSAHIGGIYLRTNRQWGSTGTIQAYNNLVWGNGAINLSQYGPGLPSVKNNLVEGVSSSFLNTFGSGNLDGTTANAAARTALLFADYSTGNYSLKSTSICIDRGVDSLYKKNLIPGDSLDIAGMPRFHGASIDIGAYEYHDTYVVVSVPDDTLKGTATGSGLFPYNTIDTLVATPNPGYEFAYWKDTLGNIVSYNDTVILTVTQDTTLIAWFRPEGTNSDASLLSLIPSAGVLSPLFSGGIYQYADTVPYAVDSIKFYARTTDPQAVINATDTLRKSLSVGDNILRVRVTSSDGWETSEYFIHVYRLNNNAYLHLLTVTDTELSPAFDSAHYAYTDTVEYAVSQVDVSAVLSDPKAEISGHKGLQQLVVGWNRFTLLVRAEDRDTTRTYTINIYRKTEFEDTDARLLSLLIDNDEQLEAPTNKYSGHYQGTCAQAHFRITISIPQGATATIDKEFTHTINRIAGTDTVVFSITSKDGTTTTAHRLLLERRLPFAEYVNVMWNYNTLMLDIRKCNQNGLDALYGSYYYWYRNGNPLPGAYLPTYSAGAQASDKLENGGVYYLLIKTASGEIVRTCEQQISYDITAAAPVAETAAVYPNPVKAGALFNLRLDENEYAENDYLTIYTTTGIVVKHMRLSTNPVMLSIPLKGVYMLKTNNGTAQKITVE